MWRRWGGGCHFDKTLSCQAHWKRYDTKSINQPEGLMCERNQTSNLSFEKTS